MGGRRGEGKEGKQKQSHRCITQALSTCPSMNRTQSQGKVHYTSSLKLTDRLPAKKSVRKDLRLSAVISAASGLYLSMSSSSLMRRTVGYWVREGEGEGERKSE